MKRFAIIMLFAVAVFAVARPPMQANSREGVGLYLPGNPPGINATLIAPCGDIRAILGPQGNNIAVSANGNAIAVLYGAPTGNSTDPMAIKIAYSVNNGSTWSTFGPFTGNIRRIYGGVDGTPGFDTNPGECLFCYMKGASGYAAFPIEVIVEENVPSAPSPSAPINVTWSDSLFPWQTGMVIAPDNPLYCMTSGWSYLSNGDNHIYSWTSEDGGYTWNMPVDFGVTVSPAYGGNSGPKMAMGTGGYVCGTFNNAVGGITNDGWPHFIESTDGGNTYSTAYPMPVPHFDSAAGQFWWHECNAQVINGKPWILANDIGGGGFWLWKGTGAPGSWTWTAWDLGEVGACSTWIADTLFQIIPGQYGTICHDPVSGMILVTYKGLAYVNRGGNVLANGPAVCGVYTYDEGATWKVCRPLSVWNTMTYSDWNGTETAHRLVNIGGAIYAYSIWIHNTNFNLYFEGGTANGRVLPLGVDETEAGNIVRMNLQVAPNVARGVCRATFNNLSAGMVRVQLFDAAGRFVREAFTGVLNAGVNSVELPTASLTSGTYFVRLETVKGTATAKFVKI